MMNHKLLTFRKTSESIYSNLLSFIDEKIGTQRGQLTCSKTHRESGRELAFFLPSFTLFLSL